MEILKRFHMGVLYLMLFIFGSSNTILNSLIIINLYDVNFAYSILKPIWLMIFLFLGAGIILEIIWFLWWLGGKLKRDPLPKNIKTKEDKKRNGTRRRRSKR